MCPTCALEGAMQGLLNFFHRKGIRIWSVTNR